MVLHLLGHGVVGDGDVGLPVVEGVCKPVTVIVRLIFVSRTYLKSATSWTTSMPGGRMGRRMAVASRRGQASELMATWSTELQLWTFKLTLYTVLHSSKLEYQSSTDL